MGPLQISRDHFILFLTCEQCVSTLRRRMTGRQLDSSVHSINKQASLSLVFIASTCCMTEISKILLQNTPRNYTANTGVETSFAPSTELLWQTPPLSFLGAAAFMAPIIFDPRGSTHNYDVIPTPRSFATEGDLDVSTFEPNSSGQTTITSNPHYQGPLK